MGRLEESEQTNTERQIVLRLPRAPWRRIWARHWQSWVPCRSAIAVAGGLCLPDISCSGLKSFQLSSCNSSKNYAATTPRRGRWSLWLTVCRFWLVRLTELASPLMGLVPGTILYLLGDIYASCPAAGRQKWLWGITYGDPILGWMSIHLPPILMFTRGFDPWPNDKTRGIAALRSKDFAALKPLATQPPAALQVPKKNNSVSSGFRKAIPRG